MIGICLNEDDAVLKMIIQTDAAQVNLKTECVPYLLKLLKSIQNLRIIISVQVWAFMCKKKVLDENVRQA